MEIRKSLAGMHVLIVVVASTTGGCSSLKGQRFDHEAVPRGETLTGVPFTLNRPIPSVTRTHGNDGASDKYEIGFDYLPDPDARFTLDIDPSMLSSVDFNMAFDANGSLIETSAKTTDQTGPLIVALGKLAATAAAFDRTTPDDKNAISALENAGNAYFAEPGSTVQDPVTGKTRRVNDSDRAAWSSMFKRIRKEADEGPIRKTFVYASSREYALLQAVLTSRRLASGQAARKLAAPAAAAGDNPLFATLNDSSQTNETREKAAEIQDAINRLDKRELAKIKAELVDKRRALRGAYAMNPTSDRQAQLNANYQLLLLTKSKFEPENDLLVDLADFTETEWQRRSVANLNKQIEARRHVVRIQASNDAKPNSVREATDEKLNELLARKALVLGLGPQRQRKLELNRLLAQARTPREVQVFRQEIVELEAVEVATENGLKSSAKGPAVTDGPVQSALLSAPYGTAVDNNWIKTTLGSRPLPLYVLALQPIKATNYGVTAAPDANAGKGSGTVPAQQPPAAPQPPTPPQPYPIQPQNPNGQPGQ
jgi:hypothetical protein